MPLSWKRRTALQKSHENNQRERTEQIAHVLYQNRLQFDRPGNAQDDWQKAEKIVCNPIRTILFIGNRSLAKLRNPTNQILRFIAWDTPRWFLFSLPKLEWIKLLAVPLALGTVGSIITAQIQRESNQNAVLKAYLDQLEELTFNQDLLAEEPQTGAIVLARGRTVVALRELDVKRRAQLIAFLQASGLSSFDTDDSADDASVARDEPVISFKNQNLSGLDLSWMYLVGVDFRQADLRNTNLTGVNLRDANLTEALLTEANLSSASLKGINLEGASLIQANLSRTSLEAANMEGALLLETNLGMARNLTQAQLNLAKLCRTSLPIDITLDPNRDCAELRIDPETGNLLLQQGN